MTRYLLDRDVMSQLDQPEAKRHKNVRAWLKTIPDSAPYVSAITVMEAWRGFGNARRKSVRSPARMSQSDAFENAFEKLISAFEERVVPIDAQVAKLWGQLRGRFDKNHWDLGVVATAITHDMVVATRNTADMKGRGTRMVDPFHNTPTIITL